MAYSLLFALCVIVFKPLTCVHMCLHVSTCVYLCLVLAMGLFDTCTFGSFVHVYMYRVLAHSMVSHHCVLPILSLCYSLFADTIFCTLCSVFIVYDIIICYCICYCFWYPFSFNDILIY